MFGQVRPHPHHPLAPIGSWASNLDSHTPMPQDMDDAPAVRVRDSHSTAPQATAGDAGAVELSIVVPALNEEASIGGLIEEIEQAIVASGIAAELIVVDDGSSDGMPAALQALATTRPWLRSLRQPRTMGQSAAMGAGIAHARGHYVATLDADGQNDPADLVRMLDRVRRDGIDFVQGDRSAARRDTAVKRISSRVGRLFRRVLLGDCIRDTGCSARMMRADIARQLPLQFKGMHRFMPVYARMLGAKVVEQPVHHRPRVAGESKYGMGILNRGLPGLVDCLVMRWMLRRYRQGTACAADDRGSQP